MTRSIPWLLAASLMAVSTFAMAAPPADAIEVIVSGKAPTVIDHATMAKLPPAEVMAAAHDSPKSSWKGVALASILEQAGAPTGKQLRGRAMASYVRVTATDGYQVVFALTDFDPDFSHGATIVLADEHDGKPLTDDGPFRLVIPGDVRPARWVRNVKTIEVVDGGSGTGKTSH
ncbi:MAG TPA: molybdopterin-dependent oxidoreductase [Luteibacter sp.]|jgi:DMSO/TMAO reductase YedYZ molybdopterin-dependent catalytic subunit|nr:molybdopterin-dependent oxidoreductase [Luteibacter sp.]